jgi:hypothetical protein
MLCRPRRHDLRALTDSGEATLSAAEVPPRLRSFAATSAALMVVFASSGTPIPLYNLYRTVERERLVRPRG